MFQMTFVLDHSLTTTELFAEARQDAVALTIIDVPRDGTALGSVMRFGRAITQLRKSIEEGNQAHIPGSVLFMQTVGVVVRNEEGNHVRSSEMPSHCWNPNRPSFKHLIYAVFEKSGDVGVVSMQPI